MRRAIAAGLVYFLVIFGLGFVLGTVRTLWVEPQLGLGRATAIELPVMLAASWIACGWVVRRWRVPAAVTVRLAMSAAAFLLLMVAELGVSTQLFDRTPGEHLATYRDAPRQLGLAAQVAFALFPLLRRQARPSASSA